MTTFLTAGPPKAETTLLLAPGAGAPMTSPWMTQVAELLAGAGLYVVRFDFPYMVERTQTGSRRPPPKAEALVEAYVAAVDRLAGASSGFLPGRLLIGGKSLGGRVASLAAQALHDEGRIAGLVCLGYPFHPPKAPEKVRTAHLGRFTCPTLIVQGERDPFGARAEVAGYDLASAVGLHWAADGDHDLAPRRSSGATLDANLAAAVAAIVRFAGALPQAR